MCRTFFDAIIKNLGPYTSIALGHGVSAAKQVGERLYALASASERLYALNSSGFRQQKCKEPISALSVTIA
jgi:hypothetical protein